MKTTTKTPALKVVSSSFGWLVIAANGLTVSVWHNERAAQEDAAARNAAAKAGN